AAAGTPAMKATDRCGVHSGTCGGTCEIPCFARADYAAAVPRARGFRLTSEPVTIGFEPAQRLAAGCGGAHARQNSSEDILRRVAETSVSSGTIRNASSR